MRRRPSHPREFASPVALGCLLLACAAGWVACAGSSSQSAARPHGRAGERARASAGSTLEPSPSPAVPRAPGTVQLAEGLTVERVPLRLPPSDRAPVAASDSLLTLLRIDLRRWDLRLLTAARHGGARTAPEWARAFALTAVINAALYLPDQRSIGLMVDGDAIDNPRDNPRLAGFLVFHPRRDGLPAMQLLGRDCPGFDLDQTRAAYAAVVQNYRMLDCQGQPIPWRDTKRYAIAGIALDGQGRVVFLHCAQPLRVHELNARLAAADLDLEAAVFVEGGRQASLFAQTPQGRLEETASGAGALASLPPTFWPVPNVIGVVARAEAGARRPPGKR